MRAGWTVRKFATFEEADAAAARADTAKMTMADRISLVEELRRRFWGDALLRPSANRLVTFARQEHPRPGRRPRA